ncbi:isochorismatase [Cupriavidus sp. SK-4]|uniref:hydrolase n=1 Tax=Cupriavidus sp. SK-4 TaxID=574750 RepID=UPI00044DE8CA|nr:hydrolase [Cupriavidus sp. SK-4]EYS88292.1 isochorismatase [Cupriavidus sp. SK-4]
MKIEKDAATLLVIDMQPKVLHPVPGHEAILANCAWLVELAEDLDVPVMFSSHYPRGLGPVSTRLLEQSPDASVLEKVHFSCVEAECLPDSDGSEQWILCGIEAHACVMLTALDLARAGKQVFVVADAIGSRSADDKALALQRMVQAGVTVVSREMVFFELLRRAGTPEFKACAGKYLQ